MTGTAKLTSNRFGHPPLLSVPIPKLGDLQVPNKAWESISLPTDVLLLTVEDDEFLVCFAHLHLGNIFMSHAKDIGRVYFGEIGHSQKKVKVALVRSFSGSSQVDASRNVVRNAIECLKPKVVFFVGHCGGLRREKTKLGDVVISAKLTTYDDKEIIKDQQILCRHTVNVSRNVGCLINWAADGWKAPLNDPEALEVEVHRNAVILSGPKLSHSPEARARIIEQFPGAVAVESECQGLYAAAFDSEIEWAIVKGVSHYVDVSESETEEWKPFSSVMAASIVAHILNDPDVLKNWPHYKGTKEKKEETKSASQREQDMPIEQDFVDCGDASLSDKAESSKSAEVTSKKPILVRDLDSKTRDLICQKLNVKIPLKKDFRGLAAEMKYETEEIEEFEKYDNPTEDLLNDWQFGKESTVENLKKLLQKIKRDDVVDILEEILVIDDENVAKESTGTSNSFPEPLSIRCTIDKDGGSIPFLSAGVFFYFPADAVSKPTTISCALVMQKDNPLELRNGEYFCSSIVTIDSEETTFAKPVTVLLPHSVAVKGPYLDYYDVTMMQYGQQWNDLETKHCIKFEDLPENSRSSFPVIRNYLPVAMATVEANCTAAVVTRIRSEKVLVYPDKPCLFLKSYGKESTLKISFPACSVEMECCLSVKLFPACEILDMHSRFNEDEKEKEEEEGKNEEEDEDKGEKEDEEMGEGEDEDLVYFPVIEVSGREKPFLKNVDVELVYCHNDVAEWDDELLPVGKKELFSPEYGVLFCNHQSDQSNKTWRTEDTNATIERLENDRVRIAFSVAHFSRKFAVGRRSKRQAIPNNMTETFCEPSSTNFEVFLLAVQEMTKLISIMAPSKLQKEEIENKWGFEMVLCQGCVKPGQMTYFCVHLSPKEERLSLDNGTLLFRLENATTTFNLIYEGLDLKGKLMNFFSRPCTNKKHKNCLQNILIEPANNRQAKPVVTEDFHETDEARISPAKKGRIVDDVPETKSASQREQQMPIEQDLVDRGGASSSFKAESSKSAEVTSKKSILVRNLDSKTRDLICQKLNIKTVLKKDFRGLAAKMKYETKEIEKFEKNDNPSEALLNDWQLGKESNVENLKKMLQKIKRDDVVDILEEISVVDDDSVAKESTGDMVSEIRYVVREKICLLLNVKRRLGGDFKKLGGILRMPTEQIKFISGKDNPADEVLTWWETRKAATVSRFREILVDMGRDDIVEIIDGEYPTEKVRLNETTVEANEASTSSNVVKSGSANVPDYWWKHILFGVLVTGVLVAILLQFFF